MGYDRGESFPFDFESNRIPFGSKSKGKLSPRSYPIQCERKWKYSFLSAESQQNQDQSQQKKVSLQSEDNYHWNVSPFPGPLAQRFEQSGQIAPEPVKGVKKAELRELRE